MDCRRPDDGDDGGCRSCSVIFRCYNNPCCCNVHTVRRSRVGIVDIRMVCWDGDGVDSHS